MTVIKCDICRKEIPVVKKNIFGMEIDVIDVGKIKCGQWDFKHTFDELDFCKKCAEELSAKIDKVLLEQKIGVSESTQDDKISVIRCKNCRNYQGGRCLSTHGGDFVESDDYCSRGERKEG